MLERVIVERISNLIERSEVLGVEPERGARGHQGFHSAEHMAGCRAWLAAAFNALCQACPSDAHPYRQMYDRLVQPRRGTEHRIVLDGAAVLRSLLEDNERGLLSPIADRVSAETFDDLLDHAQEYHQQNRRDGSGILATAVYEDTLRRIARSKGVEVDRVRLDDIISGLAGNGTITGVVAKRCRAAAGVRNAALHANWDGFTLDDVGEVIRLTRQLLEEHLGG